MAAKEGDSIHWGHETFRVGPYFQLDRIVDGLTMAQWLDRAYDGSAETINEIHEAFARGEINEATVKLLLEGIESELCALAASTFGYPNDELHELAVELAYGPGYRSLPPINTQEPNEN